MDYINACLKDGLWYCIFYVALLVLFIYMGVRRKNNIIVLVVFLMTLIIPSILDIHFYFQYMNKERLFKYVQIENIESRKVHTYSIGRSYNYMKEIFIDANGEEYLLVDNASQKIFEEGITISQKIKIKYVETLRHKVIIDIIQS